jgi:outer membrane protein TolC
MQVVDQQAGILSERADDVKKIMDEFLKQFEAGKQSNLQLMSAHARLFDAQAAKADASYRKLLSRFELLSAMGKLSSALGAPAAPPASR